MGREIREDQVLAESVTWMIVKKYPEVVEALETIKLVEGEPTRVTKVRTNLTLSTKEKIIGFLKENLDVFAWSPKDMLGILANII